MEEIVGVLKVKLQWLDRRNSSLRTQIYMKGVFGITGIFIRQEENGGDMWVDVHIDNQLWMFVPFRNVVSQN